MWRSESAVLCVVVALLLLKDAQAADRCDDFKTCHECAGRKLTPGFVCYYEYRESKIGDFLLKGHPKCLEKDDDDEPLTPRGGTSKDLKQFFKADSCPNVKEVVLGDQEELSEETANAKPCDIGFGIFSSAHLQHLVSKSFPEAHPHGSHIQDFTTSGPCTADHMSIKMGEIAKLLSTIPKWPRKAFEKVPVNEQEESDALELFQIVKQQLKGLSPIDLDDVDEVAAWKTKLENMKTKLLGVLSPASLADMMGSVVDSVKSVAVSGLSLFVPTLKKVLPAEIKPATPTGIFKGLTYGHLWRSYQRYKEEQHDQLRLPTHVELNEHLDSSHTMAGFDVLDFDDNLVVSLTLDVANLLTGGVSGAVKTAIDAAVFAAKLNSMADHEKNIQRRSDYIVNMLMSYDEHFRFGTLLAANGVMKPHYSPYLQSNRYTFIRTACKEIDRYCFYLGEILRGRVKAGTQTNKDYCVCLKIDLRTSKAGLTKKDEECTTDSDCELGLLCPESRCEPKFPEHTVPKDLAQHFAAEQSSTCSWAKLLECDSALVEVDKAIWTAKNEESKEARWCAKEMKENCFKYTLCKLILSSDDSLSFRRRTASCINASRRCFQRKLKLVKHRDELDVLKGIECEKDCQTQVQEHCPAACLKPLRFLYFSRAHVKHGAVKQEVVVSDFMRESSAPVHGATHIRSVFDALHGVATGNPSMWPFKGGGRKLVELTVTEEECNKEAEEAGDWYAEAPALSLPLRK